MDKLIYRKPADYELEHEGRCEDIDFFVSLVSRLKPSRVLQLACGSGRITQPLARTGSASGL
jgi:2-polyprenyl-3-methyl-5-hydroxy-6-metoxy-1,4-benzoquinol methylase